MLFFDCGLSDRSMFFILVFASLALVALFFALDAAKVDLIGVPILQTLASANGNHTHPAIVLAGVILLQLFYLPNFALSKLKNYVVFTGVAALLAIASWQVSPISKIWATPSWALFSVFCCVIFGGVYWFVGVKQQRVWTVLFENNYASCARGQVGFALYQNSGFKPSMR